jgi:hypothetical protein
VNTLEEVLVADREAVRRVVLFDAQVDFGPGGSESFCAQLAAYAGDGMDSAPAD